MISCVDRLGMYIIIYSAWTRRIGVPAWSPPGFPDPPDCGSKVHTGQKTSICPEAMSSVSVAYRLSWLNSFPKHMSIGTTLQSSRPAVEWWHCSLKFLTMYTYFRNLVHWSAADDDRTHGLNLLEMDLADDVKS